MSIKEDLYPIGRNRVIDLVQAGGIDVAQWGNYARGPRWAAANPRYCYEWSFVEPGRVVVLNLWHANLRERRGGVSVDLNMRREADRLRAVLAKPVWIRRAQAMGEAIETAYRDSLIIRVILNEGEMRDAFSPNARASIVKHRMLDPVPWSIASYNQGSGRAVIVRGGEDLRVVDQFDLPDEAPMPPRRVTRLGSAFETDRTVRAAALTRAKGRCEFCSRPGFLTSSGAVFLEIHHIVPLADRGPDVSSNVAALCPNHHREAHHGAKAALIRDFLLELRGS
jgi:5-methylcytosine-specific restriction protein A